MGWSKQGGWYRGLEVIVGMGVMSVCNTMFIISGGSRFQAAMTLG